MDRVITSLRTFKLTKDIRRALETLDRRLPQESDVSNHFLKLYREEWIGPEQYIYMDTKLLLNRFCLSTERLFSERDVTIGVYFFDSAEKRLWVGADPSVPKHFSEYANGLFVIGDIVDGETPEYVKRVVPIGDVDRSEHLISLNHRKDLLKADLRSFCTVPLLHNGRVIGHMNLFSRQPKAWSSEEILLIRRQATSIERRLMDVRDRFVQAAATI
ncbi:GAF domain-containing protein [Paenibacillus sp.]|uniref:GAF domain-containing protein n=1 Tax=Paenibacillus sp. TaxID=58172 RepID=UPI002811A82F|nr:GAF domain-containing protein [Paenibacillus sp.]